MKSASVANVNCKRSGEDEMASTSKRSSGSTWLTGQVLRRMNLWRSIDPGMEGLISIWLREVSVSVWTLKG
jgi:hypothetical protein